MTVFGALQSELLKTSVVGETVASSVSALAMSKTTGPSGCAVRTTVNWSVLPPPLASVTTSAPPLSSTSKPAASVSVVDTFTTWLETPSHSSSDTASTERVTVDTCVPSTSGESSWPVTVTDWAMFQFPLVNVSEVGVARASPGLPLLTLMTTSAVGSASRTTSKESMFPAPSSATVVPPDSVTVKSAMSVSLIVTDSTAADTGSKRSSEAPASTDTVTSAV